MRGEEDRTWNASVGAERSGAAVFASTWGRANTIRIRTVGACLVGGAVSVTSDIKPGILAWCLSGHMSKPFSRCCGRMGIWRSGLGRQDR